MRADARGAVPSATEADLQQWSSVPWTPVTDPTGSEDAAVIGWRKTGVPYLPPAQAVSLQTLDVWIPATATTAAPDPSSVPDRPGAWVVYIHGGAWRDPLITADSFTPAATNLLLRCSNSSKTSHPSSSSSSSSSSFPSPTAPPVPPPELAGLVSLNYRLSPHPSHPPPPGAPADPSRTAKHPDHIADVLSALSYLHRMLPLSAADSGDEQQQKQQQQQQQQQQHQQRDRTQDGRQLRPWILAGHSCGATLAFQACMSPARWGLARAGGKTRPAAASAAAVVGFNGLYDLEGFISGRRPPRRRPSAPTHADDADGDGREGGDDDDDGGGDDDGGDAYAGLRMVYRQFTAGAFGEDERVWRAVCPASAPGRWVAEWTWLGEEGGGEPRKRRKWAVLVASPEDTLVPAEQRQAMLERLREEGQDGELVAVTVKDSHGKHDDVWREGQPMVEILWEVVERLGEMVVL